jgi:hypothetical protein
MPETTDTTATKPGYKTTEWWLSKIAILLSSLFAANVIPTNGIAAKIAVIAAITLTTLGYQVTRGMVKSASAGMLILVVLLASSQPACGWLKHEAHDAKLALVDCTKGAAKDAALQFGPVVEALVAQASGPDGKLSAAPVKELAKGFTREIGGCAVAKAFASLLAPAAAGSGAPKAAQLELDPASVRAVFEDLRREQFGGATFKTDVGTL